MKLYKFERNFIDGLSVPGGVIYQIAELSIMRGGVMPEHIQRCDEITYVVSGRAKVYSGDCCDDICAGQVHYIKSGCMHKFEVYPDEDFRYICIGYNTNDSEFLNDFNAYTKGKKYMLLNDDSTVKKLSTLIVDEFYGWDNYSEEMVSRYLSNILITLYRIENGRGKAEADKTVVSHTVYKVLRYIDREFLNIESVKDMCEKLSYSEYYLSHLFREKTGTTIKEYITRKKIAYACELLKNSQLGLEEISEHLNFASSHSFRRAFKSVTGLSPREYKGN